MKSLQELFPKGSEDFFHANAVSLSPDKTLALANVDRKRGHMNKTEAEYALILEAMKRRGEILRFEFEGITLRWADMRYTPDFLIFLNPACDWKGQPTIKLIEVKGAHIWDRDIVRFKGARAYWPEFRFEMHQKTKNGWLQKF